MGGRDRHSPPAGAPAWGSLCTFFLGDGRQPGSALLPVGAGTGGSALCRAGVPQGRACLATAVPALCSWYFSGISRTEARQLLLSPANAPGAFLVRPSETSQGDYSLSGMRVALVPRSPWRSPAQPDQPGALLTLGWPLARAWPHIGPEPRLPTAAVSAQPFTPSLPPSFIHSPPYSLTLLSWLLTHSRIRSFIHPFSTHPFTSPLICSALRPSLLLSPLTALLLHKRHRGVTHSPGVHPRLPTLLWAAHRGPSPRRWLRLPTLPPSVCSSGR